jgi:hypothetical protein
MFVFDHVGLTTTEPQPDENWIEQSRCWVTNPRHVEQPERPPARSFPRRSARIRCVRDGFYEPSVARIKADLHDIKLRLRGVGTLRGILRPAFPDLEAKTEFLAAMRSLGVGGLREVAFYNWGHLRDVNLDWIPEGLAEMEAAA